MMKKIGLAVLSAFAILAAGCSSGPSTESPAQSPSVEASGGESAVSAMVPEAIRSAGVIRAAVDTGSRPFMYLDEKTGEPTGIDADLGAALGEVLGVPFEFIPGTFDAIIPSLQSGRSDVGMTINVTEERGKVLDFVPYFYTGSILLTPAGNPKNLTTEPLDLCGVAIGVGRGGTQPTVIIPKIEAACAEAGKPAPIAKEYPGQPEMLQALKASQVDAIYADYPGMAMVAAANADLFELAGPQFDPLKGAMGFPKGSELAPAVKAAMEELISNGTYQAILDKWDMPDLTVPQAELIK